MAEAFYHTHAGLGTLVGPVSSRLAQGHGRSRLRPILSLSMLSSGTVQGVEHDDMNVVCLSVRVLGQAGR
jgi:hypothetical protein